MVNQLYVIYHLRENCVRENNTMLYVIYGKTVYGKSTLCFMSFMCKGYMQNPH